MRKESPRHPRVSTEEARSVSLGSNCVCRDARTHISFSTWVFTPSLGDEMLSKTCPHHLLAEPEHIPPGYGPWPDN